MWMRKWQGAVMNYPNWQALVGVELSRPCAPSACQIAERNKDSSQQPTTRIYYSWMGFSSRQPGILIPAKFTSNSTSISQPSAPIHAYTPDPRTICEPCSTLTNDHPCLYFDRPEADVLHGRRPLGSPSLHNIPTHYTQNGLDLNRWLRQNQTYLGRRLFKTLINVCTMARV